MADLLQEIADLGFWDTVALGVLVTFVWWVLLGAVRQVGKAWRNER